MVARQSDGNSCRHASRTHTLHNPFFLSIQNDREIRRPKAAHGDVQRTPPSQRMQGTCRWIRFAPTRPTLAPLERCVRHRRSCGPDDERSAQA
jgi:hypothetical protein